MQLFETTVSTIHQKDAHLLSKELRGCRGRQGRVCVSGDHVAARDYVQGALNLGNATVSPIKVDMYNRIIAVVVTADGQNLSCSILARGHGVYKPTWDAKRLVRRDCISITAP